MKVTEFAFVGHAVADLQRARTFYEEVLKLPKPKALNGSLDGERGFLEYEIGPHTLAITTAWTDGKSPEEPGTGLVLEVDDFEAAVRHIRACGVEFELGPAEQDICFIDVISDPDGNKIGIHQRKRQL